MLESSRLETILSKHLPPPAISYCLQLWQKQPFNFQITSSRKTKLGDFRYRRDRSIQTITLNGDLNPYQFLLTYTHEVAHLYAFIKFGVSIPPHGKEWKSTFQQLLYPILNERVFPLDLLVPLRQHMNNPKASTAGDLFLMKELSKYDNVEPLNKTTFLSDLKPGSRFMLSGREFEKGETKRTRVICLEVKTGKKFLVAQMAKIQAVH